MNEINVIHPYLYHGTWVFDDASKGLVKEAFVCGMPEIIKLLAMKIDRPEEGFTVLFSKNKFPSATATLTRVERVGGGNTYNLEGTALVGWLCPALYRYFDVAPDNIYVELKK